MTSPYLPPDPADATADLPDTRDVVIGPLPPAAPPVLGDWGVDVE